MRYIIAVLLTSTAALAEVPKVVTDIPPVHSVVAMVMGDLGTPDLLLGKGADEHDFQLKPSQIGAVTEADLVVWIGPELTPWLDHALQGRGDTGAILTLFDDPGTRKADYFASASAEDSEHAVAEGSDHDDHEDEGHDHGAGSLDPHVWLDPSNAQVWAGLIAAELSRLDPEHSATYAANAAAARASIAAGEAKAKLLLDPVTDRPFVTFHDAYGYFIRTFDLTTAGTIALGDAASPGAARLVELRRTMEAGSVLCIFPEAQHDPALVEQLVEGTGARIGAALDPVGSTLEPGPDAYVALIAGLAEAMASCLAD